MKKKILSTVLCLPVFLLVFLIAILIREIKEPMVVVCVGDSITYGTGVEQTRDTDSYPAILQRLLGDHFTVINCGNPGSTAQDEGSKPFRQQPQYQQSLDAEGEIYILMLGTNDGKPANWNAQRYQRDLLRLAEEYKAQGSDTKLYLMTPPCVYHIDEQTGMLVRVHYPSIDEEVYQIVKDAAERLQVGLIDLHAITENRPEWFMDKVHPNKEGNEAIAAYIYHQIFQPVGDGKIWTLVRPQ